MWRDAGLVIVSVAAVAVAYTLTADSVAVATGVAIAVSTAAGMHARLAMGRWRAAVQIVAGMLVLSALGAPPRLVGVLLIAGVGGAELIARRAHRSAILWVGAWIAVFAGAASVSGLAATVELPQGPALREGVAAVVGAFLSAPLMLTLGPLAEWLFGHTTRLTMNEWLSYEHPLLRRLASEAPGTFQHSVNVGVLADAGAGAVGADTLLARVGSLYHDVGKLSAPDLFIENQSGPNPHDRLDPSDSARVLRAHVLDGVELVIRHRMGPRIADFVREHHGTGEMRVLREKAEGLGQNAGDETYRYPGPRPRSRETAIVMLSDQIEASARSNPPADEAACEDLVRRTIERVVDEHQLDDAGMIDRDLEQIRGGLSRALAAMYHRRRLSYPATETSSWRRRLGVVNRPRRRAVR